jgi:hypothetical protein
MRLMTRALPLMAAVVALGNPDRSAGDFLEIP